MPNIKISRKEIFVRELAKFLGTNLVAKSVMLEVEQKRPSEMPTLAKDWSSLRDAAGVFGYLDFEETLEVLTKLLA